VAWDIFIPQKAERYHGLGHIHPSENRIVNMDWDVIIPATITLLPWAGTLSSQ